MNEATHQQNIWQSVKQFWAQPLKRLILFIVLGFILLTILLIALLQSTQPKPLAMREEVWTPDLRTSQWLERSLNHETKKFRKAMKVEAESNLTEQVHESLDEIVLENTISDLESTSDQDLSTAQTEITKKMSITTQPLDSQQTKIAKSEINEKADQHPANLNTVGMPIIHGLIEPEQSMQTAPISVFRDREHGQMINTTNPKQASIESKHLHTSSASLQQASAYTIQAGQYLPAILQTAIHSDLPGMVIAKISRPVFDSITGEHVLIPQGSTLIGQYDTNINFGQSRLALAWQRLIFPNGTSMDLDNLPSVDLMGQAGLHDKVNRHMKQLFTGAALLSLFGTANQTKSTATNPEQSIQQLLASNLHQQFSETGLQLTEKQLQVQPTLEIRAGTVFHVLLTRDLSFDGQN